MPRWFALFLAVAAGPLAVLGACSDPPTRPGPPGEGTAQPPNPIGNAGAEGGAGVDGGDATVDSGAACNPLELPGTLVDRIAVAGDPPVSTGGIITGGTYDLTADVVYVGAAGVGGPTGITIKSIILISSGKIDQLTETGGAGKTPTLTRTSSTYGAEASAFTTLQVCPVAAGGKSFQFTATDTTLTLTDPIAKEAFTFLKR